MPLVFIIQIHSTDNGFPYYCRKLSVISYAMEWMTKKSGCDYVGFQFLTVVVMNVSIFLDTAPCSPYVNRRFGETYHLNVHGR
jgi:hypothetical protein